MTTLDLVIRGRDEGATSLVKRIKDETADAQRNTKSLSDRFKETGGSVLAVTGPIGLVVGGAMKMGSEFQGVINRIQAVSGAPEEALGRIQDKALQLGKDLPLSAKDAADGMYALATAGFSVEETLSASEGVARLASSQMMDVGRSSEIVAATLRGFGMEADESGKAVDILSQIASSSAAEIDDIGESIKYVGPVAGATGQSLEDMGVALGLMANQGIKGSQAGTALRSTLTRLVAPPKEAAEWMRRLGVETTDGSAQVVRSAKEMKAAFTEWNQTTDKATQSQQLAVALNTLGVALPRTKKGAIDSAAALKDLKDALGDSTVSVEKKNQALAALGMSYTKEGGKVLPFINIAEQFRSKMAGMSESEKTAAAAAIVGQEAMAGFLSIVNASDEDFNKMKSSMEGAGGATDKFSNAMNKGLGFQMQQLQGSLETLMISVFLKLSPILEDLTQKATGVVNAVIDWVTQNPQLAQSLGIVLAGLGILGPIIGGVMLAIGALMSPVTLVVGAIALLAFAWLNNFMGIRTATEQAWAFLQPIFQSLGGWLSTNLPIAGQALSDFWNNTLYPALQAVGNFVNDPLLPFFKALASVGLAGIQKGAEAASNIWDRYLKPSLDSIGDVIYKTAGPALQWFKDEVLKPVQTVFDNVSQAIRTATGWLADLADRVSKFQLPDWMQRHSPAPIEQTFTGWAEGIRDVRRELGSLDMPTLPGGMGGLGGANLTPAFSGGPQISVTVHARVDSAVDVEMLGQRVAAIIASRMR